MNQYIRVTTETVRRIIYYSFNFIAFNKLTCRFYLLRITRFITNCLFSCNKTALGIFIHLFSVIHSSLMVRDIQIHYGLNEYDLKILTGGELLASCIYFNVKF